MIAERGDVERRSTHVADDHITLLGQSQRRDRRQCGPRHHAIDRSPHHFIGRHHSAETIGEQQFAPEARGCQCVLEALHIGANDRADRRVDCGCNDTPIFAWNWIDLVAQRDRHARQYSGKDFTDAQFVIRIDHRPQQADCDGFDLPVTKMFGSGVYVVD